MKKSEGLGEQIKGVEINQNLFSINSSIPQFNEIPRQQLMQ